jgi:hypothetical protein
MAGSYAHVVDKRGRLLNNRNLVQMIENLGDAYEAIEEMYGMIWYLAGGDEVKVEQARVHYRDGLIESPGQQRESRTPPPPDPFPFSRAGR